MIDELSLAVQNQIDFLLENKSPKGVEAIHTLCLNLLLDFKSNGDAERLLEVKAQFSEMLNLLKSPDLKTREHLYKDKLEVAKKLTNKTDSKTDGVKYISAIEDASFQKHIQDIFYAGVGEQVANVIYMSKVLSPVLVKLNS